MKPLLFVSILAIVHKVSLARLSSSLLKKNDDLDEKREQARFLGSDYCGDGKRGNGVCEDKNFCCSKWGWCGATDAYCGDEKTGPSIVQYSSGSSHPCGDGQIGNGVCADSNLCCSEWGHCGVSSSHCKYSQVPPAPSPTDPSSAKRSGREFDGKAAFITYHMYHNDQSLTEVSCSNGANGLMREWGYETLWPMWPYVAATSNLNWKSPVCGMCYEVYAESTRNTVYVTAIDKVAFPGPSGEMHFDMSLPAFRELLGNEGYTAGKGSAVFRKVDSSFCRGNLG